MSVAIVIAPTEQGTEFASQLAGEIDEPATVRTSTISLQQLLALPALPWPERYLVFAEPSTARILVIRPEDRTLLLRALDPIAARASPYALAVAAAELLRAARATERVASTPPATEPPLALGASVAVGVSVVEAFGHEPILAQGVVEVDLELLEVKRNLWSTIGIAFEATGAGERTRGDTIVRYRRWDPSLRLGFGSSIGELDLGATFAAGISIARAEAYGPNGERIARDDRIPVRFALGVKARYHLGAGFGLQLEGALGVSASPANYLVRDEVALSEGRFRWQAGAAALWRWR